ncbi:hypothetical protein K458DRAFT_178383 [Lentithecium fluviatile CBS 122367]|uniref:Uncharacterized protein n=1 Tax=Lentithecium fluviatile CBS 122367 TaxID=1168545 RepID=A0A6G1IFE9_9PLEO|nr:hypothetical protein K458DRAFT_178383 [Lentithecium fluviatile CBS 122367]
MPFELHTIRLRGVLGTEYTRTLPIASSLPFATIVYLTRALRHEPQKPAFTFLITHISTHGAADSPERIRRPSNTAEKALGTRKRTQDIGAGWADATGTKVLWGWRLGATGGRLGANPCAKGAGAGWDDRASLGLAVSGGKREDEDEIRSAYLVCLVFPRRGLLRLRVCGVEVG